MATYEYKGQKYELKDGLSIEEAKEKIISFGNKNNLNSKILPLPSVTFDSTSSEPKEEKGFLSKYVGTPISSAVFGVGAGAERALEGVTTLGTIMLDAGLGTELTSKVQKAFD